MMGRIAPLLTLTLFAALGAWTLSGGGAGAREHFGAPVSGAPSVSLREAVEHPERYADATVRVEGLIDRQCPSSGCWFDLRGPDGETLRVDLGHLGLKFPKRVGFRATVEGKLFRGRQRIELIGENAEFTRE